MYVLESNFVSLTEDEMLNVDGGEINWTTVGQLITTGCCGIIGGAIGSALGPAGTAAGVSAGAKVGAVVGSVGGYILYNLFF